MNVDYDVAIIGAGAAGIGAARRLSGVNLSSAVVEASSRIGGRAWTVELGGHPIDLGCGYLHSSEHNPWTAIAESSGFHVDRKDPAWQRQSLGISATESTAADAAFSAWASRMREISGNTDRAADALDPHGEWNAYLQALSGYISGADLEDISIADYLAYDDEATETNWRVAEGYGTLIAASLPAATSLHLNTAIEDISLDESCVTLTTRSGILRARAVVLTVSTAVLAGNSIRMPPQLDPWRQAAQHLPLGQDEKYLLEIIGGDAFAPETHAMGNPRDAHSASYYIRPFGRPVIECFVGGEGARLRIEAGPAAAFAMAIDDIVALFGENVRRHLRPLTCSAWSRSDRIGGAYSHAMPGQAAARSALAEPYDEHVFFAGEATQRGDFSTAHGAYRSGLRVADEVIAALRAQPREAR
jgi:monoamine oxidase